MTLKSGKRTYIKTKNKLNNGIHKKSKDISKQTKNYVKIQPPIK